MANPDRAEPDPEAVALLSELSHCLLRIVVISGRDTAFLAGRLALPQALLIGNHGLEEREGGASRIVAEAQPYLAQVGRAADLVEALPLTQAPGVTVERKRATVSVHFRNAPDPSAAGAALEVALEAIADREQLHLEPGRLVWELRPPLELDKGEVLRRLAATMQPAGVVYVGDDRTDADAFSALRRMAGVSTLAVGVRSREVPDEVFNECDLMVEGVPGVIDLLTQLHDLCPAA